MTGLFIFSRFDSVRLPGKALIELAGKPLLAWVIERSRQVHRASVIVVATSDRKVDDPIAELALREGVELFRGSCEDVAGRASECAERFGVERFARVCGDSPFFDPALLDGFISLHKSLKADVVTNTFPRSFPPGASCEVIAAEAMHLAAKKADSREDREHITRYFYRHPEKFRIFNVSVGDRRYADVSLAVDTQDDMERSREIISVLGDDAETACLDQIVAALDSRE